MHHTILPSRRPLPRAQLSKEFEKKLELKESPDKGVYVKDLIQFVAKGVSELNNVLKASRTGGGIAHTVRRTWPRGRPLEQGHKCSDLHHALMHLASHQTAYAGTPTKL
jgi:hypothetical protein